MFVKRLIKCILINQKAVFYRPSWYDHLSPAVELASKNSFTDTERGGKRAAALCLPIFVNYNSKDSFLPHQYFRILKVCLTNIWDLTTPLFLGWFFFNFMALMVILAHNSILHSDFEPWTLSLPWTLKLINFLQLMWSIFHFWHFPANLFKNTKRNP